MDGVVECQIHCIFIRIDSPGLAFKTEENGQKIYINQASDRRAWVQPATRRFRSFHHAVSITKTSPNTIVLEGAGPGYLVLSEVDYPGWQVQVDDQREQIFNDPLNLLTGGISAPRQAQSYFYFSA